jgi:hypothetical protein
MFVDVNEEDVIRDPSLSKHVCDERLRSVHHLSAICSIPFDKDFKNRFIEILIRKKSDNSVERSRQVTGIVSRNPEYSRLRFDTWKIKNSAKCSCKSKEEFRDNDLLLQCTSIFTKLIICNTFLTKI